MIRLPNKFEGENLHLILETSEGTDFTGLSEECYPEELIGQLKSVKKFIITFSKMLSQINKRDIIDYDEIIFKVPVIYEGKKYILPIISFVNNKYSLIRGYLFGFYKTTDFAYERNNSNIHFKSKGININLNIPDEFLDCEKCNELKDPFILYRNIKIDDRLVNHELLKLDVEDSEEFYFKKLNSEIKQEVNIRETIFNVKEVYKSADKFNIVSTSTIRSLDI